MAKELKIWLDDERPVASKVKALGGSYAGTVDSEHHYFNQPEGRVLKLVNVGGKITLHKLERQGRQYVLVSNEPVADPEALEKQLTAKHGLKAKLVMHAENYSLKDYTVGIYDIEGKGKFLILTGSDPSTGLLEEWFGMSEPRIVTLPFDSL